MEFLKYEIQEIEEANLQSGEDETLEAQYQKVSHAREILSDCSAIHEMLSLIHIFMLPFYKKNGKVNGTG